MVNPTWVGGVVVRIPAFMQEAGDLIPISANPREVRWGHLPMQPSSVDSADLLENRDWGLNEEGIG